MDTDLASRIERSLGTEPPLEETDLVARGRAALLRRRVAGAASALVVGAVAVTGMVLANQPSQQADPPVVPATDAPTPSPEESTEQFTITITKDPLLPPDEPVRISMPATVHYRPDVVITSVQGRPGTAIAVGFVRNGETQWLVEPPEAAGSEGVAIDVSEPPR